MAFRSAKRFAVAFFLVAALTAKMLSLPACSNPKTRDEREQVKRIEQTYRQTNKDFERYEKKGDEATSQNLLQDLENQIIILRAALKNINLTPQQRAEIEEQISQAEAQIELEKAQQTAEISQSITNIQIPPEVIASVDQLAVQIADGKFDSKKPLRIRVGGREFEVLTSAEINEIAFQHRPPVEGETPERKAERVRIITGSLLSNVSYKIYNKALRF